MPCLRPNYMDTPMAKTEQPFDLLYAMTLPPAEAVAYFKQKGLKVSKNWHEMLDDAHAHAFTVANCAKLDVLQDIRDELNKAMNGDVGFAEFKKNIIPKLQEKGWWGKAINPGTGEILETYPNSSIPVQYGSVYRLALIYHVNLQAAFMAGRRARQLENVDDRPYWMYVAVMDSRTRPAHKAMNGLTFKYDDPFWQSFYPPNGFRCRCRVRAQTSDQINSKNIAVSNSKGKLDFVDAPLSKSNPDAGMAKVARYMISPPGTPDHKLKYVRTDPGWSSAPGADWRPNLDRYDADLVKQYRKAEKK